MTLLFSVRFRCLLAISCIFPLLLCCRTGIDAAESYSHATNDSRAEQTLAPVGGKDSIFCLMQTALYRDQISRKNYSAALIPWRNVFRTCPQLNQNLYIDGGNIYKYLIQNCSDSVLTERYTDTLMMLYDQRIGYFGNKGAVLGKKGIDLILYRPYNTIEAYKALKESIEIEGNATSAQVMSSLIPSAIRLNRQGIIDSSEVLTSLSIAAGIIVWNLNNNIKDTLDYLRSLDLLGAAVVEWDACKGMKPLYEPLIPLVSAQTLTKIMYSALTFRCSGAIVDLVNERLQNSPVDSNMLIFQATYALRNKDYKQAAEKFNKVAGLIRNPQVKALCYVNAGIACEALGQMQTARDHARKALVLNPVGGSAYVLLGDIYMASESQCANNSIMGGLDVYWAAADQYKKALSIDGSAYAEASQKLKFCQQHFPEQKTIFFNNLKEGDLWTVGCWIQEKTIVRARQE